MRTKLSRLLHILGVVTLGLACGPGCGRKFVRLDLTLKGEQFGDESVEVHLVGIRDSELGLWQDYRMSRYWSPGDPLRETAVREGFVKVLRFGADLPTENVVRRKDPIYGIWKEREAWHLFLLADLPGEYEDQPGKEDLRRDIDPLDRRRWPRKSILVKVTPGGFFVRPEPRPDKKE